MSEQKQQDQSTNKRIDVDQKCTFHLKSNLKDSPHIHDDTVSKNFTGPTSRIYDTILDHIGMTPMVRINRIAKSEGLECELLAKCEYFNAGGSVKDRIGKRMIEDAEKEGRIKKGDILIEPTSGNTGIGLALTAAIKGYRMIITLPEKMSNEKVFVLKALGAQIIRTPTEASFDSPESHIGVAKKLNKELQNSHILDQYSNPSNPMAHFDGTAEEILKQCNNKIDMVVLTAGTGGTIAGIAAKIKRRLPKCKIVGVDPKGSILAYPNDLNREGIHSYHVEGIGYDFIPRVLDRSNIDSWVKTDDKESFLMARRLIREEGLLCGGSSGSAVVGALKAAKLLKKGDRCVVLLPDSVRNYMTKFLSDDWMIDNGFLDSNKVYGSHEQTEKLVWWSNKTVKHLDILESQSPVTISNNVNLQTALDIMQKTGYDQLPVLDNDKILGVVTSGDVSTKVLNGRKKITDNVTKCMFKNFKTVTLNTSLGTLSSLFNTRHFVLVVANQKKYISSTQVTNRQIIVGILTRMDLLNYITQNENNENNNIKINIGNKNTKNYELDLESLTEI